MERYKVLGLMSGTSLDGVDVAACEFQLERDRWDYTIHAAHTFPYPPEWIEKLTSLPNSSAFDFARIHHEYGHYLGQLAKSFMEMTGFNPSLIASHGHTIFHQPDRGVTSQIGAGSAIAASAGVSVACDFRSLDVALGGQGAPLVPIGDRLLFGDYEACLNLGGFANISMEHQDKRIAFDICPVNIVLNRLARQLDLDYDPDGNYARSGQIDGHLLDILNNLEYYSLPHPKSLGREWVENSILTLIDSYSTRVENLLGTFCEHIAIQVGKAAGTQKEGRMLVTGGGAKNKYLMERIGHYSGLDIEVPDTQVVDFKEALVFALLGILRLRRESNVLNSVTGCSEDHSGGCLYFIRYENKSAFLKSGKTHLTKN